MTRKELCAVAGEPFFERVAAEDAARIMAADRRDIQNQREKLKNADDPARVQFTIDMLRLSIKLEKHGFVMY